LFDVGIQEIILILIIALIVVGPKKLPEMARSLGKGLREFRRATSEVRDSLNLGLDDEPVIDPPSPPTPDHQDAGQPGSGSSS
jgi:sec-independent protein translocase protein TatA